jgi:MFS family permease
MKEAADILTPEAEDSFGGRAAVGSICSLRYAWYVVTVLTFPYLFSFGDRYVLALLAEPMRDDLELGDRQIGLLMGFGLAIFYMLLGSRLGRLADSRSRRTVIAAGCIVWSVMTRACGLVRGVWQLLLLRMGMGPTRSWVWEEYL